MLINDGAERGSGLDLGLAVVLSAAAGGVNSIGFYLFGLFSANMTGNASSISEYLGIGQFGAAVIFASIIACFILGAFVASVFIEIVRRANRRTAYAIVLGAEGAGLFAVGLLGGATPLVNTGHVVVLWLAALMGAQNALSTKISNGRVRTTHVSGMATDLGIVLAAYASRTDTSSIRLRLYGSTIVAFIAGGFTAIFAYRLFGPLVFCLIGAGLTGLALAQLRRSSAADGT